jgi:hypothetical protein
MPDCKIWCKTAFLSTMIVTYSIRTSSSHNSLNRTDRPSWVRNFIVLNLGNRCIPVTVISRIISEDPRRRQNRCRTISKLHYTKALFLSCHTDASSAVQFNRLDPHLTQIIKIENSNFVSLICVRKREDCSFGDTHFDKNSFFAQITDWHSFHHTVT